MNDHIILRRANQMVQFSRIVFLYGRGYRYTQCVYRDYGYTYPGKGNNNNVLCVPTIYTLSVHTSMILKIAHKFVGSV